MEKSQKVKCSLQHIGTKHKINNEIIYLFFLNLLKKTVQKKYYR